MEEPIADLAYYYPQPYWRAGEADDLKNLLLFFDGIAILLPRYMARRETAADPAVAGEAGTNRGRSHGVVRSLKMV